MTVTEKLDGTNGCIVVTEWGDVFAQSRNRFLTLDSDNHGFVLWVHSVDEWLAGILGPGRHYGEWWGQGINRSYGLKHKRFSLFNTSRWGEVAFDDEVLGVVPVLQSRSFFDTGFVKMAAEGLKHYGSEAAPGFMRPEGVVVHHTRSNHLYKHLIEKQ